MQNFRRVLRYHLWDHIRYAHRRDLLDFLATPNIFTPPIVDQPTLAAIARSITDICFKWRWL